MIFWQILWLSFWTRRFHFCWKQLSNVVLNCRGSLHTENGMLCYNRTHPLLVEYFITFFPWNRMLGRALDSIYKPLTYDLHCIISVKNNFQISCKISYFGHPLGTGYGILWHKERHPLLLDCFIPFLKCMRMIMGALECIYKPLTYGQHCVISTGLI